MSNFVAILPRPDSSQNSAMTGASNAAASKSHKPKRKYTAPCCRKCGNSTDDNVDNIYNHRLSHPKRKVKKGGIPLQPHEVCKTPPQKVKQGYPLRVTDGKVEYKRRVVKNHVAYPDSNKERSNETSQILINLSSPSAAAVPFSAAAVPLQPPRGLPPPTPAATSAATSVKTWVLC